eukprot:5797867-Pyramimonas_sp.AAC.1
MRVWAHLVHEIHVSIRPGHPGVGPSSYRLWCCGITAGQHYLRARAVTQDACRQRLGLGPRAAQIARTLQKPAPRHRALPDLVEQQRLVCIPTGGYVRCGSPAIVKFPPLDPLWSPSGPPLDPLLAYHRERVNPMSPKHIRQPPTRVESLPERREFGPECATSANISAKVAKQSANFGELFPDVEFAQVSLDKLG